MRTTTPLLALLLPGCLTTHTIAVQPASRPLPAEYTLSARYKMETCGPASPSAGEMIGQALRDTQANALIEVTIEQRDQVSWLLLGSL